MQKSSRVSMITNHIILVLKINFAFGQIGSVNLMGVVSTSIQLSKLTRFHLNESLVIGPLAAQT
jgi:hypothetical protein